MTYAPKLPAPSFAHPGEARACLRDAIAHLSPAVAALAVAPPPPPVAACPPPGAGA